MKKIFYLFLFLTNILYPQENVTFANYIYRNSISEEVSEIEFYFNEKHSLSIFSPTKIEEGSVTYNDDGIIELKMKNNFPANKYYMNASGNYITYSEIIYGDSGNFIGIVSENIPELNWKLISEEKIISNIICKKAELSYSGRIYEIWYTEDIPTKFGPWKFNNLPGLIVNMKTIDNKITFELDKLVSDQKYNLKEPIEGKKISKKEYIKTKKDAIDVYISNLRSKLPEGVNISIENIEDSNLELIN